MTKKLFYLISRSHSETHSNVWPVNECSVGSSLEAPRKPSVSPHGILYHKKPPSFNTTYKHFIGNFLKASYKTLTDGSHVTWWVSIKLINGAKGVWMTRIFFIILFKIQMSLVAHRFWRVEFRIFVIVFYRQAELKKSNNKYLFEIQQVQTDELPRTLVIDF